MKKFTLKQLLMILGLYIPCRPSSAFVIPSGTKPKSSSPSLQSRTMSFVLEARYRGGTDEDDSSPEATEPPNRGRRLSLFSFSRKERRRRSKEVRMQTSGTSEPVIEQGIVPPPPLLFNDTMNNDWILRNFETNTPESTGLLEATGEGESSSSSRSPTSTVAPRAPSSRSPSNDVVSYPSFSPSLRIGSNGTMALPLDTPVPSSIPRKSGSSGPLLTRMTGQWFQSILVGILYRRSVEPPSNLQVRAMPKGNILGNLVKGRYRSNVEMTFDRVRFPNIKISGGGRVDAKRLVLNVWSFTPQLLRQGTYRFPKQFDLVAKNCTLTKDDLLESSCIRNGLGRLLVRILRKSAGITTKGVTITSIDILPSNKISVLGHATPTFGSRVFFEVRTGIGTACRGHVLTFPGLEVSLQPALGVFMPVVPDVNLDIGHNARLLRVKINGQQQDVSLDASVSITPQHTIKMNQQYIQSNEAYLAQFFFDVGQWLTKVGNFTL